MHSLLEVRGRWREIEIMAMKISKNCSQSFIIEPDDLLFYEKLAVPVPRYCPPSRMKRRLVHRNE